MVARLCLASALLAFASSGAFAQQPPAQSAGSITLNVVVAPKSGVPVAGLQKQDFTLLDNKAAQPITSFEEVNSQQAPIQIILVIDSVNLDFSHIAYEREQIDNFLHADGGHLPYPASLAIFTDTGTRLQQDSTRDGNALASSLDQAVIGLREIRRHDGFWGADDRLTLSVNAMQTLISKESTRPGRKVILWISPGWPYLSGPLTELDSKQQQQIFSQVVALSTQLRRGDITLYSVDPLGSGENVGTEFYYEEFLKGVTKPSQVLPGNLSLQVLAVQSGGLALAANNDIAGQLKRCIAGLAPYYKLTFDVPPAEHRNEYHQLDIKVAKPGLTAHTRTGYYAEP